MSEQNGANKNKDKDSNYKLIVNGANDIKRGQIKSKQIIIMRFNNKLHCHHCGAMFQPDENKLLATGIGDLRCGSCRHPNPLQFHKDFISSSNECSICELIYRTYITEQIAIPYVKSYKKINLHQTPGLREMGSLVVSTGVVI